MKYTKGQYVRKVPMSNEQPSLDTYIIRATKDDRPLHPALGKEFDYLIQKEYNVENESEVKDSKLENVWESDIYV